MFKLRLKGGMGDGQPRSERLSPQRRQREAVRQRRRCGALSRDGERGARHGEERSTLFEELGEGQNGWSLAGVGRGGC